VIETRIYTIHRNPETGRFDVTGSYRATGTIYPVGDFETEQEAREEIARHEQFDKEDRERSRR
jgi:hypothetical protein